MTINKDDDEYTQVTRQLMEFESIVETMENLKAELKKITEDIRRGWD